MGLSLLPTTCALMSATPAGKQIACIGPASLRGVRFCCWYCRRYILALKDGRSYNEGTHHALELLIAIVPESLLSWSPGSAPRLQKRICSSSASCVLRAGRRGCFRLFARFLSEIRGLVPELCSISGDSLSSLSSASASGLCPLGMPRSKESNLVLKCSGAARYLSSDCFSLRQQGA